MKRNFKGTYVNADIVESGGREFLILYGRLDKHTFIQSYQKTNGTEQTLQLILKDLDDLDLTVEFPTSEQEAFERSNYFKGKKRDVWFWRNGPRELDPIEELFSSSLTFLKGE